MSSKNRRSRLMHSRKRKDNFKITRCRICGRKTTGHHHSLCNSCHNKHPTIIK